MKCFVGRVKLVSPPFFFFFALASHDRNAMDEVHRSDSSALFFFFFVSTTFHVSIGITSSNAGLFSWVISVYLFFF